MKKDARGRRDTIILELSIALWIQMEIKLDRLKY